MDGYWYRSYRQLLFYIRVCGEYPPDLHPLNTWCEIQRRSFEAKKLSFEEKILLENIPDWKWVLTWDETYERVKKYISTNRGMLPNVEEYPILGTWCDDQKKFKLFLTQEKRGRLELLPGWSWNTESSIAWMKNYSKVMRYIKMNKKYPPKDHILSDWLRLQKNSLDLTPNQLQKLIELYNYK